MANLHLYETTIGTMVKLPGKVTAMVVGLDIDWKTDEIIVTVKAVNGNTYKLKGNTQVEIIANPEDILRSYMQKGNEKATKQKPIWKITHRVEL